MAILWWTPWRVILWNRLRYKFGRSPELWTQWRFGNRWVWLRDERTSDTLSIVYGEMHNGFYKPAVVLRPGDTVVDIGAHRGGFTIPLALAHPEVRFIALEPDPANYRALADAVSRNGARNVVAVHCGVWSDNADLRGKHEPSNTGGSRARPDLPGPVIAPAVSLAQLRKAHGLGRLRLLKMDCEGAEFAALQSSQDLVGVESILLEVHGGAGNPQPLIDMVSEAVPVHRIQVLPSKGPAYIINNRKPWVEATLDGDTGLACAACQDNAHHRCRACACPCQSRRRHDA